MTHWLAGPLLLAALACGEGPTKIIGNEPASDSSLNAGGASATGSSSSTSSTSLSTTGATLGDCSVGPLPPAVSAPDFYQKYADAVGIPVLAASLVSDAALTAACQLVQRMLVLRADVRLEMLNNGARVAIMSPTERLRDLPELANLSSDWDDIRGVGASMDQPLTVSAEENLLCLEGDVHHGEVILVHSFAHAMRSLGIARLDPSFDERLEAAYDAALFEGRWLGTFSSVSFPQYWAEGVQSWFDVNLAPPNEIHNEINTRVELETYDPSLYALIAEYLPTSAASIDCF